MSLYYALSVSCSPWAAYVATLHAARTRCAGCAVDIETQLVPLPACFRNASTPFIILIDDAIEAYSFMDVLQ